MAESYLVIPDSHGEYDRIARVIDDNDNSVDTFVFLGDILDGPDSARLVGLIRGLGERATSIAGNHEWVCRNALGDPENPIVEVWRDEVWPGYERGMLASYGLPTLADWRQNALNLHGAMQSTGDLAWLESLAPYFASSGFIALHAGPELDKPWTAQAGQLDEVDTPEGRLEDEPQQLFSIKLAGVHDIPKAVDERTFVSGHAHSSFDITGRTAERRICLASDINAGSPLYAWNSASNNIETYTND